MRIYLSAISSLKEAIEKKDISPRDFYALESFFSIQEWQRGYIPLFKDFLLDSGAFTFMNDRRKGGSVDWLSYADRYADFIKENNIKHYFELDIDSVKGLSYVEMLRRRIESRCGVQSIPVWHKSRGKDYFLGMVRDYKYVAIGGIASKEIPTNKYEMAFPWFIDEAHRNGCKIHGLGYTRTANFKRYRFDSVDSTTWIAGSKYGETFIQSGDKIIRDSHRTKLLNQRCANARALDLYNFGIWVRYARYMESQY